MPEKSKAGNFGSEKRKRYAEFEDDMSSVFVKNLSFDATEADVRKLFEKFGKVKSVLILKGKKNKSRGFGFVEINPEDGKIQISLQEKKSNVRDFIVMQAMIFPYINILWIGCIVMAIGTVLAILERIRKTS